MSFGVASVWELFTGNTFDLKATGIYEKHLKIGSDVRAIDLGVNNKKKYNPYF